MWKISFEVSHITERSYREEKIRKVREEPKRSDSFECFGATECSKPMRRTIQQEWE